MGMVMTKLARNETNMLIMVACSSINMQLTQPKFSSIQLFKKRHEKGDVIQVENWESCIATRRSVTETPPTVQFTSYHFRQQQTDRLLWPYPYSAYALHPNYYHRWLALMATSK